MSRAQFRTFCLSSNSLLFPAFALHRTLRKNILGKKAWKRICRNRNQRPLLVSGSVVPPPSPSRRLVANKQKTPQHVLVKATIENDHDMEESDDEDDEYSLPRPPGIEPIGNVSRVESMYMNLRNVNGHSVLDVLARREPVLG